jgi:hypothetical protein
MRERGAERRAQVEDTPASFNTDSSLAGRVRVLTDEEWAALTQFYLKKTVAK